MKKFITLICIIITMFILNNNNLNMVFASSNLKATKTDSISQVEINNQTNFQNVLDISGFAYLNNNIIYLNTELFAFNTKSKTNIKLDYENVKLIKQTEKNIFLLSNNKIIILDNEANEVNIIGFNVNCFNFNVYNFNELTIVAYVNGSTFGLIKINGNNEIIFDRIISIESNEVLAISVTKDFSYFIYKSGSANKLVKIDNTTLETYEMLFTYLNCTNMEIAEINNIEYFFIISNNSSALSIFTEKNNALLKVRDLLVSSSVNPSFEVGDFANFSDIKVINNLIYVSDKINSSIQSLNFINNDFVKNEILLCSASYELGRFNGLSNILFINENTYFLTDSVNNRIQKINNNTIESITLINNLKLNKPKKIVTNDNFNFAILFDKKVYIINNGNNLFLEINCEETILDIAFNHDGTLYALTQTKLLKLTNTSFVSILSSNFSLDSKIEILNNNNIAITNGTKYIQIYNLTNLGIVQTIVLENSIVDIEFDYYNNIYALTSIGIYKINYDGTRYLSNELINFNFNFNNVSTMGLNKVNSTMMVYDKVNCKLTKIVSVKFSNLQNFSHIINAYDKTLDTKIIKTAVIKSDVYVTSFPFNTNFENKLIKNQNVYVLSEINNLYYCMYNSNNEINLGYVEKSKLEIKSNSIDEIKTFEVIYKNVKIYKYPTILKNSDDKNFIAKSVNQNEIVNVINSNLPSLDNSNYYAIILSDNTIGYINASDVRVCTSEEIKPLPNTNAKIYIPSGVVKMYDNINLENIIYELENNDNIYVENLNLSNEFTFVSYVDENKIKHSGYIETKYIVETKINSHIISAYILLAVGIIVLGVAVIIFIKQKNHA